MARNLAVAVISSQPAFQARARSFGELFQLQILAFPSADDFSDKAEEFQKETEVRFVLIDSIQAQNAGDSAGQVQVAKFVLPQAGIAVVVAKRVDATAAEFIKKSGASVVVLENEYLENSKIEFILTRYINGDWIPIKVADLIKEKPIQFTIYHIMPLNGRMLAVSQPNTVLDAQKVKKFESVGEMYIKRSELESFRKYCELNQDNSAESLLRRCRAVYVSLVEAYKDMVMLLTDQSEASSFDKGKALLAELNKMSLELISSLATLGKPWQIINNSAIADFSPVDRAPAVAAYAGLLSLELDIGKPEEIMVAALLADVGLLDLSASGSGFLKSSKQNQMNAEDARVYNFHPLISLNKVLDRKVPVPESLKQIILCTHEKANGHGFPNKLLKDKIPKESFLIQLSEKLDQASVVSFGKPRRPIKEVQADVIRAEILESEGAYPIDMGMQISKYLQDI